VENFRLNQELAREPRSGQFGIVLNALYDPDLSPSVNWTPTLFTDIDPTYWVAPLIMGKAGPFKW